LFTGPRGSGKTTIARLLAKAVNCRNRKNGQFEPCNKCSSCKEIVQDNSLDIIEIDAASQGGIEGIRDLRDGIKFTPVKEKYKVFIIDEAHQLTKDAANALLKTLEEPPPYAIFVLATTETHKMIPTIISRCQRFDFRKLTLPEITERLELISKKEKVRINKPALELIALNSGGSMRDAESLLDQSFTFAGALNEGREIKPENIKELLGIVDINTISQFVDFISEKDTKKAVKFLEESFDKGYDPQEFARALINYLRQTMLIKINPEPMNPVIIGLTKEEQEKLQTQAARFQTEEISRILNLFMDAENKMRYSSIPQLPLELAIVDIVNPEK
jgi:DNA polymerase-3 subunit gamma/tau